jgi:hypothetical protein
MPPGIERLPRNEVGYPIPVFVATMSDGARDFRVIDPDHLVRCVKFNVCWICGEGMGSYKVFAIGPMCCVNRITAEPPSHRDCAVYAAHVCPFMVMPQMERREYKGEDAIVDPAGIHSDANPGAMVLWTARSYKPFRATGGTAGVLFDLGDPVEVQWFRQGREATREEAEEALEIGCDRLRKMADEEGPDARAQLDTMIDRARVLLPT